VDIEIPEPALDIPDPTEEPLAAGQKMMTSCAEASGGVKKFQGLKSLFEVMVLEATIQAMDLTFTTEKTVQYPDKSYPLTKTPFGNQEMALDGDSAWASGMQGMRDLEGDELTEAQDELKTDTIGVFRNLDQLQYQALQPTKVDGVMCNPVHVSGIGDSYQIFFLNAESNLVHMVQSPGQSPMTGAPVTQKIYVDEYQELDGFTMPKSIRMTYDDDPFATGTVEEFKANPKVDGKIFQKK